MSGHVRVCVDCGDRREFAYARSANSPRPGTRCVPCDQARRVPRRGETNPTRNCGTCGDTFTRSGYYSPAQLAKIGPNCAPCARRLQIVNARNDIDDVAVLRLVGGQPPRKTTMGEKLTAASILRGRGHTAASTAMRMGVAERTVQRYFAELAAA